MIGKRRFLIATEMLQGKPDANLSAVEVTNIKAVGASCNAMLGRGAKAGRPSLLHLNMPSLSDNGARLVRSPTSDE